MKLILYFIFTLLGFSAYAGDLEMFCLKGPVDSVCVVMNDAGLEWQTEFVFDEDGFLVELDGEEFECERGDDGRIRSVALEEMVEDNEELYTTIEMTFEYDDAGRVVKLISKSADESWTQNYRYDDKGRLSKRDYDTLSGDEVMTYEYVNFDKFGNWTERVEKSASMDQSIRHTRKIFYR